ncbi:MAG: YbaB/EbfC family nucleoid-associated protein [Planctomycetes bacterium]|nr:YbaB/EbfC family nucleoid-associated protein [Planctomycetota bacterium]MCH8966595.1 YbaB/EbfC family nucleoid-associated protein [Planctomycetota bacterium]
MFGPLGDIANLLKSAKEIQGKIAELQTELATRRYEADAGGGMVRVTVDGKGTLVDIKIDPKTLDDVELLEDLVKGAVCGAVQKSHEAMKTEMAGLTGGLNMPGLSEMLGGT